MKRISLAAFISLGMMVLILPLLSGKSATQTPQSYPLVCRGSDSLEIRIAPNEGNIGFIFTPGTNPASQGLAPGECSWVDRGMSPGEPDRLSQHVSNGLESLKSEGNTAPENRWYEELHSPNKYWTFMVYNDRQGQMIVTGARPNVEMSSPSGNDHLTLATPGVYSEDRKLYLALPIANVGAASALRVRIESISVGPGNLLTPATLPADLGDIEPGRRTVLDASFALPSEGRLLSLLNRPRLVVTLKGSYSINSQTLSFALNSVVNIPKASGEAIASRVTVAPDAQQNSPFPAQPLPGPGESEHEQGDVPPVPLGPFRKGAASPDTKVRIPGASDLQSKSDFRSATSFHHATFKEPEPDPSDDLMVNRNAPFGTNTGNPPDVSGASGSGVVFATANTFGAVSTNDGLTFTTVDPSTIWKDVFSPTKDSAGKLIDGGLCCDQIVRYLPTIDRFAWFQLFNTVPTAKGGLINKVRISVARPDDIRTKGVSGPGVWSSWSMTSATFELGENWMDFPDMAVGKNFLYFSVNKVDTGGFVARIPLADLKAGKSLHIDYTAAGVCAKMTRNAFTEVYWGILSGSSITVYNWREDSDKYSWRTVPLASWSKDFSSYVPAPDPDLKRWIYGAVGFDNVEGAARRYAMNPYGGYLFNELWFAWSAGRDALNPYPSIELVRIDAGTFNLIQQYKIKSKDYAFAYPDLAANELRGGELVGSDVGIAYLWGGNKYYGNPGVGLFKLGATPGQLITLDNIELLSAGVSNVSTSSGRSGDYLTVNPHSPQKGVSPPGVFSAFVYRVVKDSTVAGGVRWDSRAIRFGRRSFFTEIPEPPK